MEDDAAVLFIHALPHPLTPESETSQILLVNFGCPEAFKVSDKIVKICSVSFFYLFYANIVITVITITC